MLEMLACSRLGKESEFSTQHLANLVWSLATSQFLHEPLVEMIAVAATQKLHQFQPQGLANTMWALAVVDFTDASVFGAFA